MKVEKRNKLVGFQAKESEENRIIAVVAKSGKRKSEFLRDTIMREVEKQERRNETT